jgi:hypothetical protein
MKVGNSMEKRCFVIMPFSDTENHKESYWTNLFEKFIKPSVESLGLGYDCKRSEARSTNIIKDILRELLKADVVIAVLTDFNPNVWYELGTRHALCRGTIMVIEEKEEQKLAVYRKLCKIVSKSAHERFLHKNRDTAEKLPFDIRQHGIIFYSYREDEKPDTSKFKAELKNFIENIEKHQDADSPAEEFFLQNHVKPVWFADAVQGSGFEFRTLAKQARRRLFVIGQNLNFLAKDAFKTELFERMRADNEFKVDIMICRNDRDIVEALSEFTDPPFEKDLKKSIDIFTQWQKDADNETLPLTIKLSRNLGTLSLTFVDPDEDTGKLLLTPVTYRSHSSNRPCFWLTKKKHQCAFNSYFATYETLFRTMAERIIERNTD